MKNADFSIETPRMMQTSFSTFLFDEPLTFTALEHISENKKSRNKTTEKNRHFIPTLTSRIHSREDGFQQITVPIYGTRIVVFMQLILSM